MHAMMMSAFMLVGSQHACEVGRFRVKEKVRGSEADAVAAVGAKREAKRA